MFTVTDLNCFRLDDQVQVIDILKQSRITELTMSIAKYVYGPLAIILYVNTSVTQCWVLTYMKRWIIVFYKPYSLVHLSISMCIPVIELIFLIDGQMPVQQYEKRVYKKNKATKKKNKEIKKNRRSYLKSITSNQHRCDLTAYIIV